MRVSVEFIGEMPEPLQTAFIEFVKLVQQTYQLPVTGPPPAHADDGLTLACINQSQRRPWKWFTTKCAAMIAVRWKWSCELPDPDPEPDYSRDYDGLPAPAVATSAVHSETHGGKEGPRVTGGAVYGHHVAGPTLLVVDGMELGYTAEGVQVEFGEDDGRHVRVAGELVDYHEGRLDKLLDAREFGLELRCNSPIVMTGCKLVHPVRTTRGNTVTSYCFIIEGRSKSRMAPPEQVPHVAMALPASSEAR